MVALGLTIKWLGHACFLITTMAGTNIVFDPYPIEVGRRLPAISGDVVFVSHSHSDHSAVGALKSSRNVIRPLSGKSTDKGSFKLHNEVIYYKSILTYHDGLKGKRRGTNTVRLIVADGVRICHLGDLGHVLTASQVKAVSPVDVLMIPVGGVYTIDGATAKKVVQQLKPKYVIPMHYKTPWLKVKLQPADGFLKGYKHVKHADRLVVSKDSLPKETTVVVLKY